MSRQGAERTKKIKSAFQTRFLSHVENDENGKEGVDVNVKAVGPFEIVATVESEILKKWFVPKINPQKFPSKTVVSESKGNKRTKKLSNVSQ